MRSVKQGTGYERGRSGDRRTDEGMDRALGVAKANSKRKCRKERWDVLCGTGLDPSTAGPSPIHRSNYFISTGLGGSGLKNKGLVPDRRSPCTRFTRLSYLIWNCLKSSWIFCADRGCTNARVRTEYKTLKKRKFLYVKIWKKLNLQLTRIKVQITWPIKSSVYSYWFLSVKLSDLNRNKATFIIIRPALTLYVHVTHNLTV